MSPDSAGAKGITDMELEAVMVRLSGIESTLCRIEDKRLASIEEHLRTLNGRMGTCERWQAATEPVLDAMTERIDEATDMTDKNRDWITEQKGWASGRTQMVVQVSLLIGMLVTLVKIVFFHS